MRDYRTDKNLGVTTRSVDTAGMDRVMAQPFMHETPPKQMARGRQCSAPGCEVVLSIYNQTNDCPKHSPGGRRYGTRRR